MVRVCVFGDNLFDLDDLSWSQEVGHALHQRLVLVTAAGGAVVAATLRRPDDARLTLDRAAHLLPLLLFGTRLHERLALLLRHDPALLHADLEAALHAAELAALAGGQRHGAVSLMAAVEIKIVVVLHGAPEESLARVARKTAEMEAFGQIATHSARLARFDPASSSASASARLGRRFRHFVAGPRNGCFVHIERCRCTRVCPVHEWIHPVHRSRRVCNAIIRHCQI